MAKLAQKIRSAVMIRRSLGDIMERQQLFLIIIIIKRGCLNVMNGFEG